MEEIAKLPLDQQNDALREAVGENRYFGENIEAAPTPVGEKCMTCQEMIRMGDSGLIYASGPAAHKECQLRAVIGGLNHLAGRCMCHGGKEDPDLEDMSIRKQAKLIWEHRQLLAIEDREVAHMRWQEVIDQAK